MQFSDRPRFWCPDVRDPAPTLEVEFKQNRVVTAVEIRGNPEVKGHVKKADLNYRKFVFTKDCSAPNVR